MLNDLYRAGAMCSKRKIQQQNIIRTIGYK